MSERISWRKVALIGFVGALLAGACTVGDGDGIEDNDDGGASSGGSSGKGGTGGKGGSGGTTAGTSSTGGTSNGGEPATNGGEGGEGNTGNTGNETAPTCDTVSTGGAGSDEPTGTPQDDCEPADTDDECGKCIKEKCCEQWNNCGGYEPYNVCGWGGPEGEGEFNCWLGCLQKIFIDNGGEDVSMDDWETCNGECATHDDVNGNDCMQIGDETNALIECFTHPDNFECQEKCQIVATE